MNNHSKPNTSSKISCPFCQKAPPSPNIYKKDNFAFCKKCDEGFRIEDKWQEMFVRGETSLPVTPPEGFQTQIGSDFFILKFKKTSELGIIILLFALPLALIPTALLIYPQFAEGFSIGKTIFSLPFLTGSLLFLWLGKTRR